jgi:hypothetical protein
MFSFLNIHQIKQDVMDRTRSTRGRHEKCIKICVEEQEGVRILERPSCRWKGTGIKFVGWE